MLRGKFDFLGLAIGLQFFQVFDRGTRRLHPAGQPDVRGEGQDSKAGGGGEATCDSPH